MISNKHMAFSLFIFFYLCFISSNNASQITSNNETRRTYDNELNALLAWKGSLDIQSQNSLASWHPINPPCGGNWSGISCDKAGRVAGINLRSYGLRGTLQAFNWSSFTHLMNISMYNNSLHGTIPSNISLLSKLVYLHLPYNHFSGPIPLDICLLTSLQHLNLYHNNISGTIPKEIGNIKSLYFLDLSDNTITGAIPDSIGNMVNLTILALAENKLSGFIPSSIGNLSKLVTIFLYKNQLSGSIPETIGNLTSLVHLELSTNMLCGPIPSSIGNLGKLETLFIRRNQLSGSIPESIGRLTSLVDLELSTNKLSGVVPYSIGNLVKLTQLELHTNHISGELPLQFNNLVNLQKLQLGYNNFTGSLPDNICLGGELVNFTAHHNEFTGRLPRSLKNCSTLFRVRLEMNNLTGDLSEDLGIYPRLDYIDLSHNKFYGELSTNWGKCKGLTSLSISNNKVSGRLPNNLGEASRIQRLELDSNKLAGEIPRSFWNLTSTIYLSLEDNMFSGVLSKEIGMLSSLSYLNLGANNLSGVIPEEIGEFRRLSNLNLSCNTFSESIPFQIGNIHSLQNLDLNHNKLSGKIPNELSQLRMLESLNISYNEISGGFPSSLENCVSLTSIDISNNQLEGPLPNVPGFLKATFDSLKNNKGLCGDVAGLTPCSSKNHQWTKRTKVILLIALFIGFIFVIIVVGIFMSARKWQKNKTNMESMSPVEDLISFWSIDGKMVYENIIEATEDFNSRHCIGHGGYGRVYKAGLSTGQVVAVKRFHNSEALPRSQITKSFISEIRALTELRHRNIVRLFGFCSDVRNTFLVYKFVNGDSLMNVLENHEQVQNFKWNNRLNVVKGVIDALCYMHHEVSPPLVHRDISSKNILLDENFEVQVTDFGTARFLSENSSYWTSFAGTFGYSAPELAYTREISEKCDVYSFGVITLEVLTGTHPGELISSILSSSAYSSTIVLKDVIDQRISPPVKDEVEKVILITKLAFACLQQNPHSRPTMRDVSIQLAKLKPNSVGIGFSSIKIVDLLETGLTLKLVEEKNDQ